MAIIASLVAAGIGAGCGNGDDSAAAAGSSGPDTSRIASVRVYQHGNWTVPKQTPESVGKALAGLKPTWVSSLIRFAEGEKPTADEQSAWKTITGAVRATSPDAHFGIELNALEYKTGADLTEMMSTIRSSFDNDGWFFDFYTPAYKSRPEVVEAAIADAHSNGEWIGGNAFGLDQDPKVPPGSDFIGVQDFRFKIDLAAVRQLAGEIPVVFHLGNSPGQASSDGCAFMNEFTTAKRGAYATERAGQQAANHFHFAYPVFFPECFIGPSGSDATLTSYDAPGDDPMLATIGRLLDRYDN
jgi:hypothetical protein